MRRENRLIVIALFLTVFQIMHFDRMSGLAGAEPKVDNALRYLEELDKFYTQKGRPRFGKRTPYNVDDVDEDALIQYRIIRR
ncbi:Uncharacterised protein g9103 [Pycnogonum litorale]